MKKKYLVIGSGFNALATAYFLKKKDFNVKVIFEGSLKGVLGSVEIEKRNFDLGYQFFDGLDEETCNFIREMFSNQDLYDFQYGASTYSNNYFYTDHAIPYWMSYGKIFVIKAFLFYLKNFLKSFVIKENREIKKLSDLYAFLPPNIRHIMEKACEKHFQAKPHELDKVANEMSTFTNYRQTLFDDKISNFLKKKSFFFDEHLASRRKSNPNLKNISLYPKQKNMEYIADKLINNLESKGVLFEKCDFDNINLLSKHNKLKLNDESFDQVIITTSMANTQRIFKIKSKENYEHYISQIFIYFTVKKVDFNFQYTQVNDLNLYCSRISNCSLYSQITNEKNHLIIAEIPLTNKNKLWHNDDELKNIAWNEIIKCGIINKYQIYETAKVLKVSKTFAVPKANFFKFLDQTKNVLNKRFSDKVVLLGQGIFTRHKFVKELLRKM